MAAFALTLLLQAAVAAPAPPMITPARLQAAVEVFAGQPALVDPRLLLPACARPEMAFAGGGRSVMVRCAAPEWRVFIPVGSDVAGSLPASAAPAGDRAAPLVRRGDRVMVEVEGDGFVVGMEALAEADARDGRVTVRPASGGRRLVAMVDDDGHVRIRGLKSMVNDR
ncbi:MAG: flagella basal body P-ring formation protein FlgA [Sandarakinorhabdus sp.]|nr:flagella basal body P-ring formation protein FlgA [Sandarakinorhabdus sp.]